MTIPPSSTSASWVLVMPGAFVPVTVTASAASEGAATAAGGGAGTGMSYSTGERGRTTRCLAATRRMNAASSLSSAKARIVVVVSCLAGAAGAVQPPNKADMASANANPRIQTLPDEYVMLLCHIFRGNQLLAKRPGSFTAEASPGGRTGPLVEPRLSFIARGGD
ncbi:hypothetical protein JMG10_10290 [Nostoc ellipsosporum NOK]|nr:hypothetical protein [Nostoc ellipsosporum NOK]